MNSKSIDGLQRRSGAKTNIRKAPAKKPASKKITVAAPKKRRNLEVPTKKQDLKALIAENDDLEVKGAKSEQKQEVAVKEFLEEVKDVDPTDLAELPKKERKKMDKEKRKKEKKLLLRIELDMKMSAGDMQTNLLKKMIEVNKLISSGDLKS
jgi:hypothetical protein